MANSIQQFNRETVNMTHSQISSMRKKQFEFANKLANQSKTFQKIFNILEIVGPKIIREYQNQELFELIYEAQDLTKEFLPTEDIF